MMETPLISVIIPAYNAAKTIERTLQSALAQSYPNFELLVIDDGSEDATLEVVSRFHDPRLQVFACEHQGLAASRNRGLARACGDYCALLDADDLWTVDKLASQLKAMQQHPEAALAYSWTNYIDAQDQVIRRGTYIAAQGNVYGQLLEVNFLENGSNPLIRRSLLDEVGGFDCELVNAADWDMWLKLAARYPFVCVAQPQILYRVSVNSVSANLQGMETCCVQILRRNFDNAPTAIQPLRSRCFSNFYLYLTLRALETSQSRRSSLQAMQYLIKAIRHDPSILQRRRYLTGLTLAKLAANSLLSPQFVRRQIATRKAHRRTAKTRATSRLSQSAG